MPSASLFNIRRVGKAATYSAAGLLWLVRHEAAFRQELALFAALFVAGQFLGFGAAAQAVHISLMSAVLTVEALNTGLEKLVDRVSLAHHPLSGLVKDIGSAAVVLSFIPLAAFWGVRLWG